MSWWRRWVGVRIPTDDAYNLIVKGIATSCVKTIAGRLRSSTVPMAGFFDGDCRQRFD